MPDRPSSMGDDQLLAALGATLAPAQLDPPAASMARLRHDFRGAAPIPGRVSWGGRLHRPVAVGAAVLGTVVVGAGTAFAAGVPMPTAVRTIAYDVGLPVTAPAIQSVKDATGAVQSDVVPGSTATPAATERDVHNLQSALGHLDQSQQAQVGPASQKAIDKACQHLAHDDQHASGPDAPTKAACTGSRNSGTDGGPGTSTTTTVPAERRGGGGGQSSGGQSSGGQSSGGRYGGGQDGGGSSGGGHTGNYGG